MSLELSKLQLTTEVQNLRTKIQAMERSQQRYKAQLRQKAEQLKDKRTVTEEARSQLIVAEEKADEMEGLVRVLSRELHQFRRWWLTEYLSLRALSELVPDRQDVAVLLTSAEERFQVYTATL